MSEILEKIRKLKNMIDRGTFHESENAKRIYDNLIEKYSVNEKDLEEPKEFFITIPDKKCTLYFSHIARFFKLKAYTVRGLKKEMMIECTPDEYQIFLAAWEGVINAWRVSIKIKKMMIRKAAVAQDSYMRGFVITNYEIQDKKEDEKGVPSKGIDEAAYVMGMQDARRLIDKKDLS